MKNILVYHDSANPWYAALMLRGFTRFARSHRWRLVFVPRTAAAREPRRLRRLVAEFRPAGLFANYTEGLRDLAPRLLPTVWFDCATWKIVPRTASLVGADHARIGELAAEEILRLHGAKIKFADDADLSRVARGTPGFSGADLANLLNEAALLAVRKKLEGVDMATLDEAREAMGMVY